MAANIFQKYFLGLTHPAYVQVSLTPLVMDITVVVDSEFDVSVAFAGASGSTEAIWPHGSIVSLRNVDLSKMLIRAPSGALVLVVGQAP